MSDNWHVYAFYVSNLIYYYKHLIDLHYTLYFFQTYQP